MQQPYVRMERGYFDFAGDSDAGMSGKHNEDNYAIFEDVQHLAGNGSQTPVYVALVADGIA